MEEQSATQPETGQPIPTSPASLKQNNKSSIVVMVLVFVLMAGGLVYLGYQNDQLQQRLNQLLDQQANQIKPSPTPTSTQTSPTIDQETSWNTYNNTKYNYSLKFPQSFKTQVLAAGAGNLEATANSDHIFVYDRSSQEPYLERYIEVQPVGQAATYGEEWQRSEVKIGATNAIRYEKQDPNTFTIYRSAIPNTSGELEIYATKSPLKKDLAKQILETLKFSE